MFQEILQDPVYALAVIGNLVLIESLLSIDNAAVLATMVMDLPEKQRQKALKYGIIGAYVFRGLALISASWLITVWWLKLLGGLYLVGLAAKYFYTRHTPEKTDDLLNKKERPLYKRLTGFLSPFWSTVLLVELMDLAFSIDNVFAAVAFTDNMLLIYVGVFIGILAMRFVAQTFVKLIEKYPYLQTSAFLVVLVLGVKLSLSVIEHHYPESEFTALLQNHTADLVFSLGTLLIFFVPMIIAKVERRKKI